MKRRRQAIKVDTFPFLAVLLCAMGSLILLLLIIDRRAKLAARERAVEAAREEYKRKVRLAAVDKEEWERKCRELHDLLAKQDLELKAQLQKILGQKADAGRKLQEERAKVQNLASAIAKQRSDLAQQKLYLSSRRGTLAKATQKEKDAQQELVQLAQGLDQLERTLQALLALRHREQQTYSLIPYRGKHGDSRKPIYVECSAQGLMFHPGARPVSTLALSPLAVRNEVERIQGPLPANAKAKGAYLLFLVRPEGITTYYAAQEAVKELPIDFGYEFVDADMTFDFSGGQNVEPGPSLADPGEAYPGPGQMRALGSSTRGDSSVSAGMWPAGGGTGRGGTGGGGTGGGGQGSGTGGVGSGDGLGHGGSGGGYRGPGGGVAFGSGVQGGVWVPGARPGGNGTGGNGGNGTGGVPGGLGYGGGNAGGTRLAPYGASRYSSSYGGAPDGSAVGPPPPLPAPSASAGRGFGPNSGTGGGSAWPGQGGTRPGPGGGGGYGTAGNSGAVIGWTDGQGSGSSAAPTGPIARLGPAGVRPDGFQGGPGGFGPGGAAPGGTGPGGSNGSGMSGGTPSGGMAQAANPDNIPWRASTGLGGTGMNGGPRTGGSGGYAGGNMGGGTGQPGFAASGSPLGQAPSGDNGWVPAGPPGSGQSGFAGSSSGLGGSGPGGATGAGGGAGQPGGYSASGYPPGQGSPGGSGSAAGGPSGGGPPGSAPSGSPGQTPPAGVNGSGPAGAAQGGAQGQQGLAITIGSPQQSTQSGGGGTPGRQNVLDDPNTPHPRTPVIYSGGGGAGGGSSEPAPSNLPTPFGTMQKPGPRRPTPPSPYIRRFSNRDLEIVLECTADAVIVQLGERRFALSGLPGKPGPNVPLVQYVQQLIAHRQATVRPGEPPYRFQIRFRVQPEGLRAYYQAYPLFESLGIPMLREDVQVMPNGR